MNFLIKDIRKFCWICIFLCATSFTDVDAGNVDSIFHNADHLYTDGQYYDAAIAYEKIYYFQNDPYLKSLARLKRSYCLKKLGDYQKAQKILEQTEVFGLPDSMVFMIKYESALHAFLSGKTKEAESHLKQLDFFVKDDQLKNKVLYLYILIHNENAEYDEALKKTKELLSYRVGDTLVRDSLITLMNALYDPENRPDFKNPQRAFLWSTFIPGSGQIYAGVIKDGLISFTLCASTLTLGAFLIYEGYYFTGWLGGFGLFQRFYFGGRKQARLLTEKYNAELRNEYNRQLEDLVITIMN